MIEKQEIAAHTKIGLETNTASAQLQSKKTWIESPECHKPDYTKNPIADFLKWQTRMPESQILIIQLSFPGKLRNAKIVRASKDDQQTIVHERISICFPFTFIIVHILNEGK